MEFEARKTHAEMLADETIRRVSGMERNLEKGLEVIFRRLARSAKKAEKFFLGYMLLGGMGTNMMALAWGVVSSGLQWKELVFCALTAWTFFLCFYLEMGWRHVSFLHLGINLCHVKDTGKISVPTSSSLTLSAAGCITSSFEIAVLLLLLYPKIVFEKALLDAEKKEV
jgi:hypothetical protein